MQLSAHNLVIFCLQTTSTVSEVLGIQSPFRSLPSSSIRRTLTQMRCRTVAVHRRWYRSLWASTTLAVESPTNLFVASHWLERSSCRFPVTLLVFSRADHSTSQVLTTFDVVLSQLLPKAWFKKSPCPSNLRWLVPRPWRHTSRLLVMHVVMHVVLRYLLQNIRILC